MGARRIKCPSCQTVLSLPAELNARTVRCGSCRNAFGVPAQEVQQQPGLDDTVLGWLGDGLQRDEPSPGDTIGPAEPRKSRSRSRAGIRLVSLDPRSALFEFPADRLQSAEFRCAIPRKCIHCQGRAHLSAHLVIFTGQLKDSISLEAEHRAGQLTIPQEKLAGLSGTDVLEKLPNVPNVPSPANLPMPYWVCDLCNGAGAISGQIQVNSQTGKGICRLSFRNLWIAMGFFENAGGTGTKDHEKFSEYLRHVEIDRWDELPPAVRHRVQQWYKPKQGERFLAYIPDRTRRRSEDGMAGLVVSSSRLIYNRPPLYYEVPNGTAFTVMVRRGEGSEVATINAPDLKPRSITCDRRGIMLFRRSLSEGRFQAKWA
jgi:hypothetical protein